MYKRLITRLITILLSAIFLFLYACVGNEEIYQLPVSNGFSVHYINVFQGDCALICFDDGKNMLIDCGNENDQTEKQTVSAINELDGEIDYFVLTHPDIDHVGNAFNVIDKLSVKKAYVPQMNDTTLFPMFDRAINRLKEKKVEINYSDLYDYIKGENYFVAFLYPQPSGMDGSVYDEVNLSDAPTEENTNSLSPIIYIEYAGVRFLFTGDAVKKSEEFVVKSYLIGLYDMFYPEKIDLENIDFLKVAHHGGENSSTLDFLNLISPQNAIFSVGGNNIYGHPSYKVMERLEQVNEDVEFWRTDEHGTISVTVSKDGQVNVITEAD